MRVSSRVLHATTVSGALFGVLRYSRGSRGDPANDRIANRLKSRHPTEMVEVEKCAVKHRQVNRARHAERPQIVCRAIRTLWRPRRQHGIVRESVANLVNETPQLTAFRHVVRTIGDFGISESRLHRYSANT